ncbi:MAG TPA: F0F1 ATP synthase subunit delta [Steroidobacter sp.]|nr:F0F1 ATP synthase subunit delta [Steroidobacter sp.]
MRFDWWTFVLQTINFAVLVWLLHRFLYRPVLSMIDTRRAEVQKQFAEAAALEAKAKTALENMEAQRASIAAERAAALKAAATQGEEVAASRRAQAEREAQALLDTTRKTLARERADAVIETRKAALDLGTDIARRLLAELPMELRAEAWLERIEQHLSSMPSAQRDEFAKELNGHGTLHIVTAIPLSQPVISQWRTRLDRALGDRTRIEFEVDAALIAGAELYFPNEILRFSWSGALASMRMEIEHHDDAH